MNTRYWFNHSLTVFIACTFALVASMWVANHSGIFPTKGAVFASPSVILSAIGPLAVIWIGALGLGFAIRILLWDSAPYGIVIQAGTGMGAQLMASWLLAWAGLLQRSSTVVLLVVGTTLLGVQIISVIRRRHACEQPQVRLRWPIALGMPALGLLAAAATCTPGTLWKVEAYAYDVLSYHLQIPRQWLSAGKMVPLDHNVYSYLPNLIEIGYLHLGVLYGSMPDAIYASQLFHVSLAILAAVAVGCTVASLSGSATGAAIAAATLISVPWVVITGSLAYSEMGVLAFGATAMLILFNQGIEPWARAALLGFVLSCAILAKLTAGPMIAVPLCLLMWARLNDLPGRSTRTSWRQSTMHGLLVVIVAAAVLSPFWLRNAIWSGNPVFPFATTYLGSGHWDSDLMDRWNRAHGLDWSQHDRAKRATALSRQWLLNTGYGGLGGQRTTPNPTNVAQFDTEGGFPVLWAAVAVSAIVVLYASPVRRIATMLVLVMLVQLGFWVTTTHLQSRFLIPILVPATILIGLAFGQIHQWTRTRARWLVGAFGTILVLSLFSIGLRLFFTQCRPLTTDEGQQRRAHPALIINSLDLLGTHQINTLPAQSKTYMVADNMGLLYIRRPFVYHSAFDRSFLGEWIRTSGGDPEFVNAKLRNGGFTHLWVHWNELDRLHRTYGYDPDVTPESLRWLIDTGWTVAQDHSPPITLYALP